MFTRFIARNCGNMCKSKVKASPIVSAGKPFTIQTKFPNFLPNHFAVNGLWDGRIHLWSVSFCVKLQLSFRWLHLDWLEWAWLRYNHLASTFVIPYLLTCLSALIFRVPSKDLLFRVDCRNSSLEGGKFAFRFSLLFSLRWFLLAIVSNVYFVR